MPADKVRSDYEQLRSIAGQFNSASETTRGTIQNLKSRTEKLRGGDWVGKGANKFYAEMDSAVFPALNRLANAMGNASRITNRIAQIMKQAEDEASACFKL